MTQFTTDRISFQGLPGAYSDLACRTVYPDLTVLPCPTFEEAFQAVSEGASRLAMIPVENSVAGRVADVHFLLPDSGLHVVGEHFQPVRHCLLGIPGSTLEDLAKVHSHVQALGQCRSTLRQLGVKAVPAADTAGAAEMIAEHGDPSEGAIASALAAEIYGLDILVPDLQDEAHNTTRFLVLAREPQDVDPADGPLITSFVFRVRNIPGALYKGLGGFATNGINMTKLESYMLGGQFNATRFYVDVEGHPEERRLRLAMEELGFFARDVRILGVYPAHPFRAEQASQHNGT